MLEKANKYMLAIHQPLLTAVCHPEKNLPHFCLKFPLTQLSSTPEITHRCYMALNCHILIKNPSTPVRGVLAIFSELMYLNIGRLLSIFTFTQHSTAQGGSESTFKYLQETHSALAWRLQGNPKAQGNIISLSVSLLTARAKCAFSMLNLQQPSSDFSVLCLSI